MKKWSKPFLLVIISIGLGYFAFNSFYQKQITPIVFISFWISLFCLGTALILFFSSPKSERRKNWLLLFITSFICLLALEGILRFGIKRHQTYLEEVGLEWYKSMYWIDNNSYYYGYPPNYAYSRVQTEFEHSRQNNSLGIPEKEIDLDSNAKRRVLCLGDSFTEGVGASYKESWVRVMEKYLQTNVDSNIQAINAGIGGSDPFYEAMLLKGKLHVYDPEVVIFCLNTTDISDVSFRGGKERFLPDSTVQYKASPVWEPVYACSYLFRIILHDILGYNSNLRTNVMEEKARKEAFDNTSTLLKDLYDELKNEKINLFLVIHPMVSELQNNEYWPSYFPKLLNTIPKNNALDMMKAFEVDGRITQQNCTDFYWKEDRHFNPEGYWIMGEIIGKKLAPLLDKD